MNPIPRRLALTRIALGVGTAALIEPGQLQADQPHMKSALDALKIAERELREAGHDKGGHRSKALRSVRNAIAQVERSIEYDRLH